MPYNTKKAINTSWEGQSIIYILENMIYLGYTVNFKTTTKSYKSHKTIDLPKEDWLIFENTHPAIIEKSVWDKVQELRKNKRRNTKSGKQAFSQVSLNVPIAAQNCITALVNGLTASKIISFAPTTRAIQVAVLLTISVKKYCMISFLHRYNFMLEYLNMFEDEFVKSIMDKSSRDKKKEVSVKKRHLERNKSRISELDDIFKRIYEDNMKGKLSDERFAKTVR